ncbi:MAG: 50S ribosomal protein L29 [Desulfobacteraceae bacterium IS3]|jgi:large subunit ribosomal protein L29|nr:MAG: 50S ribosomal protein L29 [Desulfobacteraceae bacterium IS3]HAO22059.1 50S ribosomal protein L29 [Desulfobacteraceae bacterium]
MKASELRQMSGEEMQRKADDLKQELFNLRFQQTINEMKNSHKMKQTKRDIARIKTIIRETMQNAK